MRYGTLRCWGNATLQLWTGIAGSANHTAGSWSRKSSGLAMATASRYQAVKQGGPFEIVPASKPQVEKGEVLINIKAVAVNPIDFKQLYACIDVGFWALSLSLIVADQLACFYGFNSDYGFYVPRWPATLGADGAGVVEDVGEDVQTFKKGDEVLARFTSCDDRRAAFQVRYCYSSVVWSSKSM